MDIALIEMIMDVAGITQSKIQLCEEKKHEEIPQNICKKYNINNQLYSIYRVSQSPNEEIQQHLWSFYQSVLYFLKKDYFMLSEESLVKEYERFLVSFKNDIEKMFYITQQKVELDIADITNKDFLKSKCPLDTVFCRTNEIILLEVIYGIECPFIQKQSKKVL